MKALEITGQESATDLIKQLVCLRLLARQTILTRKNAEALTQQYRGKQATAAQDSEDWALPLALGQVVLPVWRLR